MTTFTTPSLSFRIVIFWPLISTLKNLWEIWCGVTHTWLKEFQLIGTILSTYLPNNFFLALEVDFLLWLPINSQFSTCLYYSITVLISPPLSVCFCFCFFLCNWPFLSFFLLSNTHINTPMLFLSNYHSLSLIIFISFAIVYHHTLSFLLEANVTCGQSLLLTSFVLLLISILSLPFIFIHIFTLILIFVFILPIFILGRARCLILITQLAQWLGLERKKLISTSVLQHGRF